MAEIKASDYSVYINKGIGKELNSFFNSNKNKYGKLFILVDENSLKYCYPQLVEQVGVFKEAEIIEIESGEESKNIEVCTQIWITLSEYGADRNSLIVNLGGGVICDMGGFIASVFKRGIRFLNIPTTLLSQVDASIGGKVGIDLNHLKNEIGLFNNPVAVFVDPVFLTTLDKRQTISGFAEIIKHALIADVEYWKQIVHLDVFDHSNYDTLIDTSVRIKNAVVLEDPKEMNFRKILNFGHTIGHAIETFFLGQNKNKHLLHGEALAVGMICEAFLSTLLCKLSSIDLKQITQFIMSKYETVNINESDFQHIIDLMKHDKKNSKDTINFSLLSSIGKCEINKLAKPDLIKEALNYYIEKTKSFK